MSENYPDTDWAECDTLVKLNDTIISKVNKLNGDSTKYVLKSVFDITNAAVRVAIEDWPGAIGSVWDVIQDIYHIIGGSKSVSMQKGQIISLEERLSSMETFLEKEFGYKPPRN